jgi:hypothetical protein
MHEKAKSARTAAAPYTDSSAQFMGIATGLLFVCLFALNALAY